MFGNAPLSRAVENFVVARFGNHVGEREFGQREKPLTSAKYGDFLNFAPLSSQNYNVDRSEIFLGGS